MSWSDKNSEYLAPAYTKLPITIIKGNGCYLFDEKQNQYIDMFAGVGVNQLGYNHPALNKVLVKQAKNMIHAPYHFYNPNAIEYAQKISEYSIKGKVFFTTSGAEATESVLKMLYKRKKRTSDSRNKLVVFKNSFHGRTLGAVSLTRQPAVYQDYPSTIFEAIEITPNSIEEFQKAIKEEKPLAFLMEPVLGSGGVFPISDEFMIMARKICDETNTLLIMDEIQTGMCRTGTFFSYKTSGIKPDAILFGKGSGGGIPLGGVIIGDKLLETYQKGDHGTTWANPPLATSLGLAAMEVLVEQDVINVEEKAAYLFNELTKIQDYCPHILTEIRYKGLMFGLSTTLSPELARDFQLSSLKNGILIDITQGNIIRLLPPLIITHLEINEFLTAFKKTLKEFQLEKKLSLFFNGGQ
ncbi:aminotransferase class III-fold pyridoxal phosphate-dependent enzyme [Priestia sp. SB1]|uniref:aspartate aminotransferase family protein n=1 Tax=Priestia sp. SB1 TaxID=3132359 RepID=UPI00317A9A01